VFPPGGSVDQVARVISQPLQVLLGQPVIVDNKGGALGSISIAAVAKAKPDGYTFEEKVIYEFCTELHVNHAVSDVSYTKMLVLFGERGVIDLTSLCGYYGMLATVMNVARTPVPEGGSGGVD
jgi:4-carboxymuconolactone decarboxylase